MQEEDVLPPLALVLAMECGEKPATPKATRRTNHTLIIDDDKRFFIFTNA